MTCPYCNARIAVDSWYRHIIHESRCPIINPGRALPEHAEQEVPSDA